MEEEKIVREVDSWLQGTENEVHVTESKRNIHFHLVEMKGMQMKRNKRNIRFLQWRRLREIGGGVRRIHCRQSKRNYAIDEKKGTL